MANGFRNNPWNPELEETLIRLVREGYSGGVIASRLGLSRNSVIGKVHRLGMQLGNSRNSMQRSLASQLRLKANYDRKGVSKPRIPVIPRLISEPLPPANAEDIARKTLAELAENDCRYPIGHVGEAGFGFCALEKAPGSSYCPTHMQRCSAGIPVRRRPEASQVRETTEVMA